MGSNTRYSLEPFILSDSIAITAGTALGTEDPSFVLWNPSRDHTSSVVLVRITNGATGPTVGLTAQVQFSPDSSGSDWWSLGTTVVGGTANDEIVERQIPVGSPYPRFRVIAGGNTGQDVTILVKGIKVV